MGYPPVKGISQGKTLAGLGSAHGFITGTRFAVTDCGGNIAVAVNGQWRFELPFSTTWANRPPINLVPAGAELQVTDYGYQKFISDGTYWRPAQGRAMIYSKVADSISTPIATLSAAGVFALPGGSPVIPAGMIAPQTKVCAVAQFRKYGSSGSVNAGVRLGTAGSTSDSYLCGGWLSNTNWADLKAVGFAFFGTQSNRFITGGYQPENTGNNSGVFTDPTTNVDTTVGMLASPAVTVMTAGDTAALLSLQVWLEG